MAGIDEETTDSAHEANAAKIVLGIAGAVIGVAAGAVNAASSAIDKDSPYKCPRCGVRFGRVGIPSQVRHVVLGGTTCWSCGCEISNSGDSQWDGSYQSEAKNIAREVGKDLGKAVGFFRRLIDK